MVCIVLDQKDSIELSSSDRLKNTFITGLPGNGITYYFSNLILQDVSSNQPSIVIDPYGDLSNRIIKNTPEKKLGNIAYIDIWHEQLPVGLNIFQARNEFDKKEIGNIVLKLMYDLYDPQRTGVIGPRFDHAVRNAITTIFYDENPSFLELLKCLTDSSYVNKLVGKITDPIVKNYWTKQIAQTSDFHKSEILDYIVSKFSRFVSDTRLRKIVCQPQDTIDFQKLLQEKKTILLDFSEYYYDREANTIISSLLFSKLSTLFRKIHKTPKEQISLYIDEVSLWNPQVIADLMQYSGLYNLAITTLSSRPKQIDPSLKYEILRSGTIVAFRSVKGDIEDVVHVIDTDIKTISELKKFHMVLRTLENGTITKVKKINTTQKENRNNNVILEKFKDDSQIKYGKPVTLIEADIAKKMR